ncbi:(R)-mandelonitrile lyase-like [Selaginella moellendorffii]|uniref:(R)-mandelonitrile lyase-like n=1 Tax=Selaginella moellendorffii TaxID=88036 RepID=UPI000D1D0AE3|nr:(R)-mandelonitrile lyase-like [Selaginella moellendorffii]|eukprot:XP_024543620.1 (R)-mandelonitrile lyase-like [Selaginella moellendorffii]
MLRLICFATLLSVVYSGYNLNSSNFIKEASTISELEEYDYIIVGGGTAGCPLAATLSEYFKVLVLERGGSPYRNPNITQQSNIANAPRQDPAFQQFTSEDGVANLRANVLGGGSSINGGLYSRAELSFLRQAKLDETTVNKSYAWVEKVVAFEPTYKNAFQSATRTALVTVGGSAKSAFGVMFKDNIGQTHTAILNEKTGGEVIVCAGALGSPQLLMLSGIGPIEHLKPLGMNLVLNSPQVGKEMRDNPSGVMVLPSPIPLGNFWSPLTVGVASAGFLVETMGLGTSGRLLVKVKGPQSFGELLLKSKNASETPSVRFNYFKSPEDIQRCVAGINTLEEMALSSVFAPYRYDNQTLPSGGTVLLPNRRNSLFLKSINSTIADYCKKNIGTFYHYHGGCLKGEVIDDNYKVIGTNNLRVVDGSTFKSSPGTNPQATVMMLGRYVGTKLLLEKEKKKKKC